jgi:uncharacterized protein
MSLAALQEDFLDALLHGGEPPQHVAPADGLEVYRRNVAANWLAALAAAYPVVQRLVGEEFFAGAARAYMRRVPSASGDLHALGNAFGEFLEGFEPARSLPYLPDVARLEWAVHESYHAPDARRFDFAALASVPPAAQEGLRLRLAPCVRLVESPYAILAVWEANQPGLDGTPARFEGPDRILVTRMEQGVLPQAMDMPEWRFLTALAAGAPLGAAIDALGSDAERLPALLARFTAAQVIDAFDAAA